MDNSFLGDYRWWWRQHPKWREAKRILDWFRSRPKIIGR